MRKYIYISLSIATLVFAFMQEASAQRYPERRLVRQGNKDYSKGNYIDSEVDYRRALEKNPDSYEAQFNLGNALYKQERYDEAEKIFGRLAENKQRPENAAASYYNQGNALFEQGKLQEALEAYKNSLRANPSDREAKYNYAYVKKLLEQDDDQDNDDQDNDGDGDGGGGGGDDQNNEGDDPENDSGGDDNEDEGEGDNKQNNEDNPEEQEQNQQPQQGQSGMTQQEAEQLLEAMQNKEDQTREKVEAQNAQPVSGNLKNW